MSDPGRDCLCARTSRRPWRRSRPRRRPGNNQRQECSVCSAPTAVSVVEVVAYIARLVSAPLLLLQYVDSIALRARGRNQVGIPRARHDLKPAGRRVERSRIIDHRFVALMIHRPGWHDRRTGLQKIMGEVGVLILVAHVLHHVVDVGPLRLPDTAHPGVSVPAFGVDNPPREPPPPVAPPPLPARARPPS